MDSKYQRDLWEETKMKLCWAGTQLEMAPGDNNSGAGKLPPGAGSPW